MSEKIILINESQRPWSLPGRAAPERIEPKNRGKLDERGRPRTIATSVVPTVEKVVSFRPPLLEVGGRVEVPRWYFDAIRSLPSLAKVWNRKKDGIAVGRSREERVQDAVADSLRDLDEAVRARRELERRHAQLAVDAEQAHRALEQRDAEIAAERERAESNARAQSEEIARLRALLEKRSVPDDKSDAKKSDESEKDQKRSSRNG